MDWHYTWRTWLDCLSKLPGLVLVVCTLTVNSAQGAPGVRVVLEGVSGDLEENVKALLMLTRQQGKTPPSKETIERLFEQGPAQIRMALEPFGYYRAQVDGELLAPRAAGDRWTARFRIDPGEQIVIQRLEIEVDGEARDAPFWPEQFQLLSLAPDRPLLHTDYEESKRQLIDAARREGYLDARYLVSTIRVDRTAYVAEVELRLESGPLYRFGPVHFQQQEQGMFNDRFLQRFVAFKTGAPYTVRKIAELRNALYRSGYFQEVEIGAERDLADDARQIPIEVKLTQVKPNRYQARLGYGTDTKFGMRLNWDRRYQNRFGHRFNLGTIAVQDRNKLIGEFRYIVPLRPLQGSQIELLARYDSKDLTFQDAGLDEGGESRIVNNSISVERNRTRQLWGDIKLKESIGLSFVVESQSIFDLLFGHFSQSDQDFFAEVLGPDNVAVLEPDFKALVPRARWTYLETDNAQFQRYADFLDLNVFGALDGYGSNTSFLQTRLKAGFVRGFFERGRLIGRTDVGYTRVDTLELLGFDFNQMPEAYEFRTGGDRSVRGYEFESLLPENSFTGGRHQLTASIEYEHKILEDWSLAAFYDIGNTFNSFNDMQLKAGTGIGLRWYSPVGPMRLDFAHALEDGFSPLRVHVTIGIEF